MTQVPDDNSILVWTRKEEDYPSPEKYIDHVLEQYKLAVESSFTVSAWRNTTNNFFMTSALGGFTAAGWLVKETPDRYGLLLVGVASLGVTLCIFWHQRLVHFRALNSAKFRVINRMEEKLPARFFDAEWDYLKRGRLDGFKPASISERALPVTLGAAFALLFVGSLTLAIWMALQS